MDTMLLSMVILLRLIVKVYHKSILDGFKKDLERCKLDNACNEVSVSSVNIQDAKNSAFSNGKKCNENQVKFGEKGNFTCKEKVIGGKKHKILSYDHSMILFLFHRYIICAVYTNGFLSDDKCFETGTQYYGGINAGVVESNSVKHCKLICETTNNCNFFTFIINLKECLLRRTVKGKVLDGNYVSGRTNCEEKGEYSFDDITT